VPISDNPRRPAIAMKGISKEFPWPGSRCGWIEIYNYGRDARFDKYVNSILSSKMNEVCSTTLPQKSIPAIMTHPEYKAYLAERTARYEKMSNITYNFLKEVPGLLRTGCQRRPTWPWRPEDGLG
jgi:aspartate/methionine/tyrosine aminotransferase